MTPESRPTTSFRDLHYGDRPLLLPNAWDVASAVAFADAGFPAVGTTSFGGRRSHWAPIRCCAGGRISQLAHVDRATGEPVRRYEHAHPGDLLHVDVKKLGNIPDGASGASSLAPRATATLPPPWTSPAAVIATRRLARRSCTPCSTTSHSGISRHKSQPPQIHRRGL
jgi:hypothetical protein